jgi:cytochrome c oxidase subunit 2
MRLPGGTRRWAGASVLALVASVLLSACGTGNSPSFLQPVGTAADKEAGIFWFILIIATIVFVAVTGVLLYSVIRFRSRAGAAEPRQVHGNTTIEIVWTVVPSVLLFVILGVTISTMFAVASPASSPAFTVRVIGHQWWWEFQYPDAHVVTADELHIPVNTVVRVQLDSDNVIHSFWVPQLSGKMDVIPGHTNFTWLDAKSPGVYRGECTEFCGVQHAHMDFIVVAQSMSDYQAWLAGQQTTALTPADGSQQAAGLQVFLHAGCVSCHTINGVPNANIGKIGPNLTHFGSRQLIAGGVLDNNAANLKEWILHAQTVKNGSDMPSFDGSPGAGGNLSPDQIDALVAYLESLQ